MSKSIYTHHYVYRITNVLLNKHYYGSRSCKCNPRDDLGIKYFSSSKDKDFVKDQKEHPEHYLYKIIRICETRKDAYALEILLHEKFDVGINESFYNRCKATSTKFNVYGIKFSEETRKKISDALQGEKNHMYGKKHSNETRKKIGEAQKGKQLSEEHRKKLCESKKGKKHSEEHRKKISEAQKGKKHHLFTGYYYTPFGIFTSTYEQKILHSNTLRRWCKHFEKNITKNSFIKSKYLQENFDESIIGKTFADIGFSFEYV
jgi:hypothetical protein